MALYKESVMFMEVNDEHIIGQYTLYMEHGLEYIILFSKTYSTSSNLF